jgi:solute:Na+ symporter, SSS family
MTALDWTVVVLWVVGTSSVGLYFFRHIRSTSDFLLTGRRLSWWQSGLAHAADALDATDFVSSTGQTYRIGIPLLAQQMHGVGFGFLLMSRWIIPLMYRSGVYTNAEYLELRYNATLRVASVIVQTLYRFVVMGMVVYSVATVFHVLVGVDLWGAVWAVMLLTMLYVFTSGQLGVAMAAVPQVAIMVVSSLVVFGFAWADLGGMAGLTQAAADFPAHFHFAGKAEPGVPGGVYLGAIILSLITYPIVNQTVAQRFLAARSEVQARTGCYASLIPWCLVAVSSGLVGVCALVSMPELSSSEADFIYPKMLAQYLPSGLLGVSVAALVVASMSTGAGIGTALGGLFTVDVYARFLKPGADDRHYLRVSRIAAALTILVGALFARGIPAMGGLLPFYLAFTGTLFLPLTVPYIGGALYRRASRRSGVAAVGAGFLVGAILMLLSGWLPTWLGHPMWRPYWSFSTAWAAFFLCSFIENRLFGPIPPDSVAAVLNRHDLGAPGTPDEVRARIQRMLQPHQEAAKLSEVRNPGTPADLAFLKHPGTWEAVTLIVLVAVLIRWW